MAKEMNGLDWLATVLVLAGAVNWLLVGAMGFNLVEFITGGIAWLYRTVYILVGVAGLYSIGRLSMFKGMMQKR